MHAFALDAPLAAAPPAPAPRRRARRAAASAEATAADARPAMLVLATDGLWGAMGNQEVAAFVAHRVAGGASLAEVALALCGAACEPARSAFDNVSVVLIAFKQPQKEQEEPAAGPGGGDGGGDAAGSSNAGAAAR